MNEPIMYVLFEVAPKKSARIVEMYFEEADKDNKGKLIALRDKMQKAFPERKYFIKNNTEIDDELNRKEVKA